MKKKSALKTKPTKKNAVLLTMTILGLCVWSAVPRAAGCIQTTSWNDGTASWFDPTKWSNGVPNSSKDAFINNGGTANINSTGATACNLILGYNATQSGNVSVNGGSLAVTNEVEVGAYGKGKLTITNGATVSAGLLTIAALQGNPSSSGTVTVDGATFTITGRTDVGGDNGTPGGVGLMTVVNGGSVISTAGYLRVYSSGTLTGNGAVSTSNGTTVDGTIKPNGTLTIGGDLTFASGGAMQCNVTQSSWDRAEVSGTATLGGRLSVTMTGTFTTPADFPLLHASGLLLTFSSFSVTYPGCLAPSIVYDYVHGCVYLHVESTCQ